MMQTPTEFSFFRYAVQIRMTGVGETENPEFRHMKNLYSDTIILDTAAGEDII
jgi:hypothetical protein